MAIICFTLHGVGLIFRLVFLLALLRYTSSTIMGLYALAASIEVVVVYVSGLEFHTFTARRYVRKCTVRHLRLLIRCHRRLLAFTVPFAALLTLFATEMLRFQVGTSNLAMLLIIVATSAVTQEIGRYMMLMQRPVASVILGFIRGSAWQPLAIPWLGTDISTLRVIFCLWAAFSFFGMLWGLWILRDFLSIRGRPRTAYIFAGIWKARGYHLIAVSSVLQGNLERFMLQLTLGTHAVGTFAFFQTLANTIPALVQSAITNIETPKFLEKFGQHMVGRIEFLVKISWRVGVLVLVLSIVIWSVASTLISLINRPEYIESLWILPALLVAQALLTTTHPVHLSIYAAHQDRLLLILMGVSLALSIIVNTLFIKTWAIFGAVAAPVVICTLIAVGRITIFRHLMRVRQI